MLEICLLFGNSATITALQFYDNQIKCFLNRNTYFSLHFVIKLIIKISISDSKIQYQSVSEVLTPTYSVFTLTN